MTTEYTENFRLNLPDFRMGPWHDLVNEDFVLIDQLIMNALQGVDTTVWTNGTAYNPGTTAIDPTDNTFWVCLTPHTSAATGTFSQDRTAHPGNWNRVLVGLAPRGPWARSTHYLPNDLVTDSGHGIIAVCVAEHVSTSTGTILDDAVYWSFLVQLTASMAASSVTYNNSASGTPHTDIQSTTDELYSFHVTQAGQISANTSAISANTGNITTNTANIATNTAAIASNTAAIATKIGEAPSDSNYYARRNGAWANASLNFVAKSGDIMTGTLTLAGDPVAPMQAATKQYVDAHSGGIADAPSDGSYYGRYNGAWQHVAPNTVFGASGVSHTIGLVPDPGATAGTTRYLREDGTWNAPPGGSGGGIPEAPSDGTLYGRISAGWQQVFDNTNPLMDGSAASGTSQIASRKDHVHPTDSTRAPLASPTFTGVPKSVTPATADNSTAIATTAYVQAQGYTTLAAVAAVGYAPLASPTFTGTPAAPTVTPSTDNSTKLATTGFVQSVASSLPAPPSPASAVPLADSGTGAVGTSLLYARQDHVHPAPTGGGASVTISDTPPASPSAGNLWWESDTGVMYIYYNDGTSSQWVVVAPQPDVSSFVRFDQSQALSAAQQAQVQSNIGVMAAGTSDYTNILWNTGMEVDQAYLGVQQNAISASQYVIDGWQLAKTGTMVFSTQRTTDAPPGFSNSLKFSVTTAEASMAASDYALIMQNIEGYRAAKLAFGTANAMPVALGFWTKIHRTGMYSGVLRNYAANRSYAFTFTQNVADTWEYKTISIPGDVAGTWLGGTTSTSLQLIIAMGCGTTYLGTAGAWTSTNLLGATGSTNGVAATTDTFQIAGASLIPGLLLPTAAQSPLLKRPYDQELTLCRRYWWCSNPITPTGLNGGAMMGYSLAANTIQLGNWRFTVPMRVVGTLYIFSNGVMGNVRNSTTGAAITVGNNPANTYMTIEGGAIMTVASLAASTWVDFDLWADARP